jgi:hypothetical protein
MMRSPLVIRQRLGNWRFVERRDRTRRKMKIQRIRVKKAWIPGMAKARKM